MTYFPHTLVMNKVNTAIVAILVKYIIHFQLSANVIEESEKLALLKFGKKIFVDIFTSNPVCWFVYYILIYFYW